MKPHHKSKHTAPPDVVTDNLQQRWSFVGYVYQREGSTVQWTITPDNPWLNADNKPQVLR